MVWKLDRLGRSVRDLITLVSELQDRGIHFRSLTDSIDTSTPAGRFFFHVMSALGGNGTRVDSGAYPSRFSRCEGSREGSEAAAEL